MGSFLSRVCPPVRAVRLEATHAEERSHGSGDGLDSEGDDTSSLPSADETNLTIVADEFVRAHEGALIEVDIPPPPDPIEVGVGQVHRRIINPRLDQPSSTNVPIAVYLTPGCV